jgi:SAM-dependent methyltransferase
MKSTERFSDRVHDYARYRPGYPPAVLEVLRGEIGLVRERVVADIGSGTGLSARLFLENGNRVIGVEPNRAMREAAEARLGDRPGFRSVAGTAEATTLESGSVDLVVAAQSFHWFEPVAAGAEAARILRPDGWAVLLWNTRRTESSAFLREYEALLLRYGTDYDRVRHDRVDAGALAGFFGGPYERRAVPNEQALDLEGLTGRLLSASYTPPAGHLDRALMLDAAERLFERHQQEGQVRFQYETEVYMGRLSRPVGG